MDVTPIVALSILGAMCLYITWYYVSRYWQREVLVHIANPTHPTLLPGNHANLPARANVYEALQVENDRDIYVRVWPHDRIESFRNYPQFVIGSPRNIAGSYQTFAAV